VIFSPPPRPDFQRVSLFPPHCDFWSKDRCSVVTPPPPARLGLVGRVRSFPPPPTLFNAWTAGPPFFRVCVFAPPPFVFLAGPFFFSYTTHPGFNFDSLLPSPFAVVPCPFFWCPVLCGVSAPNPLSIFIFLLVRTPRFFLYVHFFGFRPGFDFFFFLRTRTPTTTPSVLGPHPFFFFLPTF